MRKSSIALAGLALTLNACGADEPLEGASGPRPGFDDAAQQELIDVGVGKYLGTSRPDEVLSDERGTTSYIWKPGSTAHGPICLLNTDFRVFSRRGTSRNLLIYLQGGGACWSDLCAASSTAGTGIYPLGWTDGNTEQNPLGSYDVVFVSYCDGSVFSGDNDLVDPKFGGPDGMRHQRGLVNLSAGIDIALQDFPTPKSIVLAGSSAGGYGTLMGTAVVRLAYPHTPLSVINDAGAGLTNPDDPETFVKAREEWKFDQFVPPSCEECKNGQFTPLIGWAMSHDPTLRVGMFSAYEDDTIGNFFLGMSGPGFHDLLMRETDALRAAHPEQFARFFIDGKQHTALFSFYDSKIDGVTIPEWTRRVITPSLEPRDLLEPYVAE
ncbi:MAG: pectin acetylesterase-family hydrolase [Sorangiineae bacterium]|nr:pectin acetylesterase-family hydrolase [Polyangiaceae bacterium]MEB2321319.1 pectin acetylesterase-family hydrolase [Sorangiineae bacterium]